MDYRDNKSSYQTNRYNEQVLSYTKAGAATRLQRRGLKNDGKYGKIDNLHITLKGNRLHYVLDDAENLMYEGAVEFQGDESNGSAFGYNANGGLITDTGKGIMHIDYDDNNYPRRIQFANGNVTEYIYTATGEKLRAVHYTAVPNIEVGSGETHTLTDAEILFKDSTDYHGSLIMENSVPSQYLFDGGYCKLKDGSDNPAVSYHYYDRDHLGNIRGVIDEAGTVEQITNYYPFGAPYSDVTTTNPTLQRYKYNGKELELMHGLKWYDYGARWYDPLLVSWNRPDPSHKDYYPWSPYAYCMGNPIRYIDLYGLFPTGIITIHYQKVPKAMSSSITGVTMTTERQTTYYNFTKSAAHLLSLVSGVSEGYIRNVRLEEFKGQPKNNCITLGSRPENTRMLVSPAYFDESKKNIKQYYDWWFDEFSHEVGHIRQIERDQSLGKYLIKTVYGYIKTMSHDMAPREEEAERGSREYELFNKYVKNEFKTDLTTLFIGKESEEYKINQLDKWWNSYKKQER